MLEFHKTWNTDITLHTIGYIDLPDQVYVVLQSYQGKGEGIGRRKTGPGQRATGVRVLERLTGQQEGDGGDGRLVRQEDMGVE